MSFPPRSADKTLPGPFEWLVQNDKRPYIDRDSPRGGVYWFGPENYGRPVEPDDRPHTLPACVYDRLASQPTYPDVKMYLTQKAALKDFEQAYYAAREAGELIPEPRGPDEDSHGASPHTD